MLDLDVAGNNQIEPEQLHDHKSAATAVDLGAVLKQETGTLGLTYGRLSHERHRPRERDRDAVKDFLKEVWAENEPSASDPFAVKV